jgi:hypothetical protein
MKLRGENNVINGWSRLEMIQANPLMHLDLYLYDYVPDE